MSKIEWTEKTWNPVIGCDKVSAGCKNCYAMRMAYRLMHNPKMAGRYAGIAQKTASGDINWTGEVKVLHDQLTIPLATRKPTVFFVNSMSDLFHESVPFEFIDLVFEVMERCPQHTFQILTKRPEVMLHYFDNRLLSTALPNVWMGVSVENQQAANDRIPYLLRVPAAVRFLSMEPLLGPVTFRWASWHPHTEETARDITVNGNKFKGHGQYDGIDGIDWVICGGESGPGSRPMHPDWVRTIRDQCKEAGIAFFFKQWGTYLPAEENVSDATFIDTGRVVPSELNPTMFVKVGKTLAGRLLDGVLHDEMPTRVNHGQLAENN